MRIAAPLVACIALLGCSDDADTTVASTPTGGAGCRWAAPSARPALADRWTALAASAHRAGRDGAIQARPERARPARVTFVGDVALTYQIALVLERREPAAADPGAAGRDYPFHHVAERLRRADLVVGNLECVMSTRGALATDRKPLQCPEAGAEVLRQVGFGRVSVANNHAMDFGPVAFRDMLQRLDRRRLPYFGAEIFIQQPQPVAVHQLGRVRLGLLAYYGASAPQTLRDVRRARSHVDVLAVFAHWGIEHQPEPMEEQRRLARRFIEEGADLVVGTHAHVLQPVEPYAGKLIAYGLGNFVFPGMGDTEAHRRGALLEVEIDRHGVNSYHLVLSRLDRHGVPHLVGGD